MTMFFRVGGWICYRPTPHAAQDIKNAERPNQACQRDYRPSIYVNLYERFRTL